jgi:hypothetical protein
MTAEYLDRSSLVARMKYYEKHTTEESGEHYAYSVALREIRNAPAADVAEVVFARWEESDWREYDDQSCETIRYPKAAIVCTNCRCAFKKDTLWKRNYCPSCGARMSGQKEETNE